MFRTKKRENVSMKFGHGIKKKKKKKKGLMKRERKVYNRENVSMKFGHGLK
jgi:hypothetical protein